jgi:hypothetical protein
MSAAFNFNTVLTILCENSGGCKLNALVVEYLSRLPPVQIKSFSIDAFVNWLQYQDGIAVVTYTWYMDKGPTNKEDFAREKMFVCTK